MKKIIFLIVTLCLNTMFSFGQGKSSNDFDVIIRGGTIYDGSGGPPTRADIGIKGDMVTKIGDLRAARAASVIDASGMAVAPGFINMLSWSVETLIIDPRSMGELKQGVTTQIFGEG